MNILVLGAAGMLGHKLMQSLATHHVVRGTVRGPAAACARHPVLGALDLIGNVNAEDPDGLMRILARERPAAVVNAIGLVKQRPEGQDPVAAIAVNALFPHRLARLCRACNARLVHVSTDCVYSGRKGGYREDNPPDPDDLYGRSKLLGEPAGSGCLTLRTSLIGRELGTRRGLVEWLVSHRGGVVSGYARAVFSGLTTATFADLVARILERHAGLDGTWHAASAPIDKFRLLGLLNERMGLGIRIARDEEVACDRSLDGSRLCAEIGWEPPSWPEMIDRMAADPTPYSMTPENPR